MKSFHQYFLQERFINLVHDHPDKKKYAEEVHKILHKSYEPIGGLHGDGYETPHDMIKNIPMWKLKKHNGKIVTVAMYKDRNGRKLSAVGTDQSVEGKKGLHNILVNDLHRSYAEISGKILHHLKKNLPAGELNKFIIPPTKVKQTHPLFKDIQPPDEGDEEVQKYPELSHGFYRRKIGNHWHTKIMVGTLGKKIQT